MVELVPRFGAVLGDFLCFFFLGGGAWVGVVVDEGFQVGGIF